MEKTAKKRTARRRVLVAYWMLNEPAQGLLGGVEDFARENGLPWDVEALNLYQPSTLRLALSSGRLDGAVLGFDTPEALEALARAGMPAVFLRYGEPVPRPGLGRVTTLDLSFGEIGREAARLFLDGGGFRAFAFVEATRDPRWSVSRGDAFAEAVAGSGIPFFRFSSGGGTFQAAVANRDELSELGEWLRALPKPAAVFAATDERARDAVLSCREAGLDVPRSVAVLGVNNDAFSCRHVFPNLSSVDLDYAALGRAAAEEMRRLFERRRARTVRFSVPVRRVVQRASTASSSPGGALVRRALDWIDAHALDGAGAADAVRALGVSRSLLDLRFRELGAGTVQGAVQERRLREARRLLAETGTALEDICRLCGWRDPATLRRLFRRRHGVSMRAFRNQARRGRPEET